MGFEDANDFVNKVLVVESQLTAMEVLSTILQIEQDLGQRPECWGLRIIDIDMLFYNKDIVKNDTKRSPSKIA